MLLELGTSKHQLSVNSSRIGCIVIIQMGQIWVIKRKMHKNDENQRRDEIGKGQ